MRYGSPEVEAEIAALRGYLHRAVLALARAQGDAHCPEHTFVKLGLPDDLWPTRPREGAGHG